MRRLFVLALSSATLGILAASALAATRSVKVGDNYFVRSRGVPTVTVQRGTTVRFTFAGDNPHNVTVSRGPVRFKSPTKTSGSYSRRVTRKGTYTIVCTVHGAPDQSMKLVVR